MSDELDDGSVDYPTQYKELADEHKNLVAALRNHVHVVITNALNAAQAAHTSICLTGESHYGARKHLSDALHSNLIIAGVGRQALNDLDKTDQNRLGI